MVLTGARSALAAVTGAAIITTAGCGGGNKASGESANKGEAAPARVTISPDGGEVRPDERIVVRAAGGSLDNVVLDSGGTAISGDFTPDRSQWRSRWPVQPGTRVSVRATARNADGRTAMATGTFRANRTAGAPLSVSQDEILESNKRDTYGVGLPIILNFDRPVSNKAAVERSLEVTAEKPVEGAWRWFGDKQVVYRPKTYWPAHQTVTLTAHLSGVQAGKDLYGLKDLRRTYKIGAEQIAHLNIATDKMRVDWDGKPVRRIPISAGMGGSSEYTTTSGVHLNMEKEEDVVMTSPGRGPGDAGYYSELIHYAVRVSGAGEYLHQTPGDEDCLGNRNCSHGCIRQPREDAIWYFKHAQAADPVEITGTDRQVEADNGWGYYQMSWNKWLKGSALKH
jgi:lipoprotein-anchoring transpeptidase ErfK/SrfK